MGNLVQKSRGHFLITEDLVPRRETHGDGSFVSPKEQHLTEIGSGFSTASRFLCVTEKNPVARTSLERKSLPSSCVSPKRPARHRLYYRLCCARRGRAKRLRSREKRGHLVDTKEPSPCAPVCVAVLQKSWLFRHSVIPLSTGFLAH